MADAGSHRRAGVAGAPLQPFPRGMRGFVGRERELRHLLERAGDRALHVAVGAAGVGTCSRTFACAPA